MATILLISPHLDDACLSFGGQISQYAAEGDQVLVYTVFAGSPVPPYSAAAERYHQAWDITGDPVAPRRGEDISAMKLLGATPLHGDFLDAIYRRDEHGDWLVRPGTRPHTRYIPEEPRLLGDISNRITALVEEHDPELVITAAAVGTHVDHQRARDAAIAASMHTGVQLLLWEDLPYALWTGESSAMPDGTTLADRQVALSGTEAKAKKYLAVAEYGSQLPGLEYEGAGVLELLERRRRQLTDTEADAAYGEVTWKVTRESGQG